MDLRSPLIIDPSSQFLDALHSEKRDFPPPATASALHEAYQHLARHSGSFSGIFLNPRVSKELGLRLVHQAHDRHLGTPIYLLQDERDQASGLFSRERLDKLAIQEVIRKPISYPKMVQIVKPIIDDFDFSSLVRLTMENEAETGNQDYVPIRADCFISGSRSFFDLFLFLKRGQRYLKIIESGDPFSPDRLEHYLSNGVTHFYILRSAQRAYLEYCQALTDELLKRSAQVPGEIQKQQTLHLGQQTLQFLQKRGLDPQGLAIASKVVGNLRKLTTRFQFRKYPEVSRFLSDIAAYEHGVSTALVATLLIQYHKFNSTRMQAIAGTASLFHDIGVQGLEPDLRKDLDDTARLALEEEKRKRYEQHPLLGAELLRKSREFHPVVVQAVEQHHESRNGHGFPRGLNAGQINLISEVVSISEKFAQLIQKSQTDERVRPYEIMEKRIFHEFSYPVIEAFKRQLLKR